MKVQSRILALWVAAALAGCPSSDPPEIPDTGAGGFPDAVVQPPLDVGFIDLGVDPPDTGLHPDADPPDDGVFPDADPPDTGVEPDTGVAPDTGATDSGPGDAAADAATDAGVACPAPGLPSSPSPRMSFFVSSVGNGNAGADLGGLAGADERCRCLAAAVGAGGRTWRAYLSTAPIQGAPGTLVHARDRIGAGPWFNYDGVQIASTVDGLHSSPPGSDRMLDEYGRAVPAAERDVLTGSDQSGFAHAFFPGAPGTDAPTCLNWTSGSGLAFGWVGRADWNAAGGTGSWNDDHSTQCDATGLGSAGGAGRLYCFAIDGEVTPDGGLPDGGVQQAIWADPASISVDEGATASLRVRLAQPPTADVVVVVQSNNPAAVASPLALTFTPTNWATQQTVTIAGQQDADAMDANATISLLSSGIPTTLVPVVVVDDDRLSLVVSTSTLTIAEGGTGSFDVRLSAPPAGLMTVTVVSADPQAASVSPASLSFTAADWSTPQTVTLTGVQDADDANETVAITVASTGVTARTVTTTVIDDDGVQIVAGPTTLSVDEGRTGQFFVRLSSAPSGPITVDVVSPNTSAVTVSPATLSFTPANYVTPQVVTVTGVQDANTGDESVPVRLSATGLLPIEVTVAVRDDDTLAILAVPSSVTVAEGQTQSFGVRLSGAPSGSLVVAIASSDPGAVTAAPTSLTFTAANFATPQTVTITGVQDADTTNESASLTLSAAGAPDATVAVTVTDDDVAGLVLSATTLTVGEAGQGTVELSLSAAPSADVTVTVASSDPAAATASPTSLTFTPANFATPQTVTIAGVADGDTADETVTISFSPSGLPARSLTVTVIDDDRLSIVATPTTLTVDEGGTATFTVVLSAVPTANLTVSIASSDAGAATAAPATLTFTPGNATTPQTVTVTGVQDADTTDEAATLTLSATGLSDVSVGVAVRDDDALSIVAAPTALSLTEGQSGSFTVRLSAAPAGTVTVALVSADPGAATITPASLVFTPGNGTTPQTVNVTAVQDADTAPETVAITLSATNLANATVTVSVADDDVLGIVPSVTALTVDEGQDRGFSVTLSSAPTTPVTVSIASADPGAATVAPASLVFTAANFSTPQTVTVSGVQDADDRNEAVNLTLSAAGLPNATVAVTVADDDTQRLVLGATTLRITEGAQGTIGVRLGLPPAANVTVAVASSDAGAASVTPTSLVFTTANWNQEQLVTVQGVDDLDTDPESVTLSFSSAGLVTQTVAVTVEDDDRQTIFLSQTTLTVAEGGQATVNVNLALPPVGTLIVSITSDDPTAVAATPSVLTFTAANFDAPQTVALSGLQDADTDPETARVSFAAPGVTTAIVVVSVTDDDAQAIVASASSIQVVEGGQVSFGVTLSSAPTGPVTVRLASSNAAVASVDPTLIQFGPSDFDLPRTVTVSGVADDDLADGTAAITLSATGLANLVLPVTVSDDDAQRVLVDQTALGVLEGATASFGVRLAFRPAAEVVVTVASSDPGAATVAPTELRFGPTSFSTPQAVTVTGVQDADTSSEQVDLIVSTPGAPSVSVRADVTDDDVQALFVSRRALTVGEGASGTFTVALVSQPAGNLTVNLASDAPGIATVSPTTLVFTAANFRTPQTVTVTGVQDPDPADGRATVTVSAAGLTAVPVVVDVVDDDVQSVLTSVAALTIGEGATGTFTARLAFRPTADVRVQVASSLPGVVSATPAVLVFTPASFDTPQTVSLAAAQDADVVDGAASIQLSGPGLPTAAVAVTVDDDDTQAIVAGRATVTLDEGSEAVVGVRLAFAPAGPVTVAVAAGSAAVTVAPTTLRFDARSYQIPQEITITAAQDADLVDGASSVTLSSAGLAGVTIAVTILDDDRQAIVLGAPTVTVIEGQTAPLTARLAFQPAGNVTVAVGSSNPAVATVAPATLAFTTANWNVAQTVTISGVDDADTANGASTLSFTATGLPAATAAVTVTDDDTQQIFTSADSLALVEGGTASFGVRLVFAPTANVEVRIASSDAGAATAAPTSLIFTPANFNVLQTVTVTGVQDDDVAAETPRLTLSATGLADVGVDVAVRDDDVQAIVAAPASLSLTEGQDGALDVRLAFRPSGPVVVELGSTDPSIAAPTPSRLSFGPANFDTAQRVSVSAVPDLDVVDDAAQITLRSAGLDPVSVLVTVRDDDRQAFVIDRAAVAIAEGGAAELRVRLAFQPDRDLTVTVASSDAGALSATPGTIAFTPQDYATARVITLRGLQDADVADETVTVGFAAGGVPAASVTVTIDDDDVQSIVAGATAISVLEGATETLGVRLAHQPTANVVVAVASSDPASATARPASLTFTPANWDRPQSVSVDGVQDLDLAADAADLILSSAGLANLVVPISVTDDDAQSIFVSARRLSVDEGGTTSFAVNLVFAPAADTTVTVTSAAPGVATAAPTTLVFTPANFATPQPVTVLGTQDADAADAATTLSVASAGLTAVGVDVAVRDDDRLALAAEPAAVALVEGGTGTLSVRLTAAPPANVTIQIASSDAGAVSVAPSSLSFTPANFATPQTVTLTGVSDDDVAAEQVSLSLSAAGLAPLVVPVSVAEDDVQAIVPSAATLSLTEGGSASLGVRLAFRPAGEVRVSVASSNPAAAGVAPTTLAFTAQNYATPQAVTVRGIEDVDLVDATANLTLSAAGLPDRVIALTITDDDQQAIVTDAASLTVIEGQTANLGVRLAFRPAGAVVVTAASSAGAVATVTPATLSFGPQTWDVPQALTVAGVDDMDTVNGNASLSLSSAAAPDLAIPVTVTDDDVQQIFVSANRVTVPEGGSRTVGVSLVFAPTANVTVTAASRDPATLTVAPVTLSFTPANYRTPQPITLTGVQDLDVVDGASTVVLSGAGLAEVTIAATIDDDDVQGIVADAASLTVAEGAVATVGIRLAFQPAGNVTVGVASSDPGSAAVAPASLTFTPQNFQTPQAISVSGVQDLDVTDDRAAITLSAPGLADLQLGVVVDDDDQQAVLTDVSSLALDEGGRGQLAVRLAFQPAGDVTVTVASSATAVATALPATLTFTPASYATPQTVTVEAPQDVDLAPGQATLSLSAVGAAAAAVDVRVTDDDVQAIVPSAPTLTVLEGATATFGVRLAFRPAADVVVVVSSADPQAASLNPGILTFTPASYDAPQTVTVTGVQDVDLARETVDLTLSAGGVRNATVRVTVTDDDAQALFVSTEALTVAEGGTGSFGVSLVFAPMADVTVTVASGDPASATVSPTTLVFSAANYNVAQRITVVGVSDLDAVDDPTTVTVSSAGLANATVAVTVDDDDVQAIVADRADVQVAEGGTASFGVRLAFQPVAPVTVAVTSRDPVSATATPATLTFTPANYTTPQAVTIGGAQDVDVTDDATQVVLASPGLPNVVLPIAVIDEDRQAIVSSVARLSVDEGGAASFTVNLAFQPAADVTVAVASSDPGAATAAPATLSFTPLSWNQPQTVTVRGTQDVDLASESPTLTLSAGGLDDVSVAVTVADDDTQAIVPSAPSFSVLEGESGAFELRLAFQPAANVTVTVTSADRAVATVAPATLTFTPASYATPQRVTVTGIDDVDVVADTTRVTLAATGLPNAQVEVTVTDDDAQALFLSASALTITEGESGRFDVNLVFAPPTPVTVTLASSDAGAATPTPATLTFTPQNYATRQTVTVAAPHDDDLAGETVTITARSTGLADATVAVTVGDDDRQAILAGAPTVTVGEGQNATLGVRLAFQPAANVQVAVASADPGAATVAPANLVFTAANWNQPQNVTIAGLQDDDVTDDPTAVRLTSAGLAEVAVPVTVDDDDVQAIQLSAATLTVAEGATGFVEVRLAFQPPVDTVVAVTSSDPVSAAAAPATLSFTRANWAVAQRVTITGPEDVDLVNDSANVLFTTAGVANATLGVTVTDDDTQAILAGATAVSVREGANATVGVRLAFQPGAPVTVDVSSSDPGSATVAPAQLTFTPANYATPQNVTVAGVQDVDVTNDTANLLLASDGLPNVTLRIDVTDDDAQAIFASARNVPLPEGESAFVDVTLVFQPANDVTVTVASADAARIGVAPLTLLFTPNDFDIPQSIQLTAAQDLDAVDDQVNVTLSAPGLANVVIGVDIDDDDVQGVVISNAQLAINEGATDGFDVSLAFQPRANVTVSVTTGNPAVATAAPTTLTFTPANYLTTQRVTVTAVQDLDVTDGATQLTVASAGLPDRTVAVAVTDDDVQGIVLSANTVTMDEGQSRTVTARLAFRPANDVTVTVASSDPASASAAPATLTFTPASYDTPQTVTITGPDDDDSVADAAVITLSANGLPNVTVQATVNDLDVQAIVASVANLTVVEGRTGQIGVRLAYRPVADTQVGVASGNANAAPVDPPFVVFTPANYATPQNLTVVGVDDIDLEDVVTNVTLSSPPLPDVVVPVTIDDDDLQRILLSAPTLTVLEGATDVFTANLAFQPSANVVVAVTSSDPVSATAAPATLTFTPQNWDQPQNVTVGGPQDVDLVDDRATITLSTAGVPDASLAATVTDDDGQRLVVDVQALTVGEGATGTFGVRLAFQPTADVVVTATSDDPISATVAPAALTFTPANWDTVQRFTVAGPQDLDVTDDLTTVTVRSAGLADVLVAVTVDDEDVQAILLSRTALTIPEGQSQTFDVRLAFQPAADTFVDVASSDPQSANAAPFGLNFTPANWNTNQTVTVVGPDDADLVDDNAVITMSAFGLPNVTVAVTVTDDDVQRVLADVQNLGVGEGGTNFFGVILRFQPSANVTVTVTSTDAASASVSPATLTFTPANFDLPQLVTVTGVDDPDAVNDTADVLLTSAGLPTVRIPILVTDDEIQQIVPGTTLFAVDEGVSGTIGVRLAVPPLVSRTVTVTGSAPGVATVTPATLTFTAANFSTPQNITITGVEDDDNNVDGQMQITLASAGLLDVPIDVTVFDNDPQRMVTTATSVRVGEGQQTSFAVRLRYPPLQNVAVAVGPPLDTAATVAPLNLVFTPANWNQDQTLTVTGVQDQNVVDELDNVSLFSVGLADVILPLRVVDDDRQAIVASTNAITLDEGGTTNFTVRLAFQPAAQVVVNVATSDPGAATVDFVNLNFDPTSWDIAQPVTVTGVQDVDLANETPTLTLTAPGLANVVVAATVNDEDRQAIVSTAAAVTVGEGQTQTFGVSLAFQPAAAVTVAVASSDAVSASVAPATLTFTPANYATPQNVTVTGEQDLDSVEDAATITLSSAGLTNVTVAVTVTDDDGQSLVLGATQVTVLEGATETVSLRLQAQPVADVVVTVASSDAVSATATPATLTFTPVNWNTPQNITVGGPQDDDVTNDAAVVTVTAPNFNPVTFNVTVTDDDTQAIQTTLATMTIAEGANAAVGVRLAFQPAFDVAVAVTSADVGAAAVDLPLVTFTPQTWNVPQNIIVAGIQDVDLRNEQVVLTFASQGLTNVTVAVTVNDDDVQAIQTDVPTLTVLEGGTGTFTARLAFQPNADTIVTVASSDPVSATAAPAALTFSPANYDTPQIVTVAGPQDTDLTDDQAMVTLSTDGVPNRTVAVTVTDDDTQAFILTRTALTVPEGLTATVGVSLRFMPAANVNAAIGSSDDLSASVSPANLLFTSANYAIPQTITIFGPQDADTTNDAANINITSAGIPDGTVAVTVQDDDGQQIVVDRTDIALIEGQTATVAVRLGFQPAFPVDVAVGTTDAFVANPTIGLLTFTPQNWNTPQNLPIVAPQDLNLVAGTATVTLTSQGVPGVNIRVAVTDDDIQAILTDAPEVVSDEGFVAPIGVFLRFQPAAPVTVTVASTDPTSASVTPASLTFTPQNWDLFQDVTIFGPQDDDVTADNATLTLSSPGIATRNIPITIRDDDVQGIVVSALQIGVTENQTGQLGVNLLFRPAADTVVTITSADPAVATVTPGTLTFTPQNYNVVQNFTVRGTDDDNDVDGLTTIALTTPGVQAANVDVIVFEDDFQEILVDPTEAIVREGATSTIGVSLRFPPTQNITVTLDPPLQPVVERTPTTLTFTPANYATRQIVTLTGLQDQDVVDNTSTMALFAPGLPDRILTVISRDDDTQRPIFDPTTLTVAEGEVGVAVVSLAFQPVNNVVVTLSSGDTSAVTVAPATLTFGPTDWDFPQQITLTGVQDADELAEMVTITAAVAGGAPATMTVTTADDDVCPAPGGISNPSANMSFFVTSVGNLRGGNYGGLDGADRRCECLAAAVGRGGRGWRAYLSTAPIPGFGGVEVHARDRIGTGPWVNYSGTQVAADVAGLHATPPTSAMMLDEYGNTVPANRHSILTGTNADGTARTLLPGAPAGTDPPTCGNWTSGIETLSGWHGHTDWNTQTPPTTWNNVDFEGCSQQFMTNRNGDGRLYCFATELGQRIIATPTAVSVNEGGTATFAVTLGEAPAGTLVVSVASADTGAATVTPATLSFTAGNFSTPQTVTVSGVQDADAANESVALTLSATGLADRTVSVTVQDDDVPTIVPSATTVALNEGGTGTFTVRLSTQPAADTTVAITSADTGAATVAPATLTFTTANFATPQTVTITGVQDADLANESVALTLSAGGLANVTVTANVTDDETQVLVLTTTTLAINEGATGTFGVRLAANPNGTVTVNLASSDTGAATVAPATLTFTAANFGTDQTVTVTGVQDADQTNETVTITASGAGAPNATVTVTVTDDDASTRMSFFVTSRRIEVGGNPVAGGNLGGLAGADAFCLALAREADATDSRTWRAYLSSTTVDARDRIGAGPWFNASGVQIAANPTALHTTPPATNLILDERGRAWNAVSTRHDILTGSNSEGRRPSAAELTPLFTFPDGSFTYPNATGDFSCQSWTSNGNGAAPPETWTDYAIIGHVDWTPIQQGGATNPRSYSWNSSHVTACDIGNMEADLGDARVYCFVAN